MVAAHVHDGDCNICYWPCEDANCDKPQVFVCPNHKPDNSTKAETQASREREDGFHNNLC